MLRTWSLLLVLGLTVLACGEKSETLKGEAEKSGSSVTKNAPEKTAEPTGKSEVPEETAAPKALPRATYYVISDA